MVRSLWLVESHLTVVAQSSRTSQSPLPDRETLPPVQRTWTETAERMGAKHWKRSHPTNVPVLATNQIGQLNRKQPRVKNTHPYSGGLRSGRDAAPDAQTTAQNAEAHAHTAAPWNPFPSKPSNGAASALAPCPLPHLQRLSQGPSRGTRLTRTPSAHIHTQQFLFGPMAIYLCPSPITQILSSTIEYRLVCFFLFDLKCHSFFVASHDS